MQRLVFPRACLWNPFYPIIILLFAAKFVNVGWGKKETQFHGSAGKQAAKQTVEVCSHIPTGVHRSVYLFIPVYTCLYRHDCTASHRFRIRGTIDMKLDENRYEKNRNETIQNCFIFIHFLSLIFIKLTEERCWKSTIYILAFHPPRTPRPPRRLMMIRFAWVGEVTASISPSVPAILEPSHVFYVRGHVMAYITLPVRRPMVWSTSWIGSKSGVTSWFER